MRTVSGCTEQICRGAYLFLMFQYLRVINDLCQDCRPFACLEGKSVDLVWRRLQVFLVEDAGPQIPPGRGVWLQDRRSLVVERHDHNQRWLSQSGKGASRAWPFDMSIGGS